MPELKFIVKNANGRILFKDASANIIQDRPDYEAVGLTGELYPESITVGAGENAYSFVIPANGGITYTPTGGTPTTYTGNAAGLLAILSADFFNASTGSGGGGGGDASAALQQQQLDEAVYQTQFQSAISGGIGGENDSPATNPNGSASQIALQKGIFANGFKSNIFELVIDPITGTEYLKLVALDPNTPPIEFKYYDPATGLLVISPTNPTYPVATSLGVGEPTDLKTLDPNDNASLVSLSKGQLENLALMQEVLGYGSSPTVIDPALGGTIPGILKGLLSMQGLTLAQRADLGYLPNASVVRKSGKNFDVDIATVPESVWNGGGLYTGFPLTAPATLQAVSSSAADAGTLTVTYLATATSTDYTTGTIAINGTTPVNSTFTAYRVHTASYASTASIGTQFNAGTITVRYAATPATVFIAMPAGTNQSYMGGYTIPFGKKGYLMPTTWRVGGAATDKVEGAMWIRPNGLNPRLRRNCTVGNTSGERDNFEGGIWLDALTDVMPLVRLTNANNVVVEATYDIILLPV